MDRRNTRRVARLERTHAKTAQINIFAEIGRSVARSRVLQLLSRGGWYTAAQVNEAAGSSEGTRRLRELRANGYAIEKKHEGGRYIYHLQARPS